MHHPNFIFSHRLVNTLCELEGCKTIIDRLNVSKAWDERERFSAISRNIADVLKLEGINIPLEKVKSVLEGSSVDIISGESKQSILNLRQALEYIDTFIKDRMIDEKDLLELNHICLNGLPKAEWHSGKHRTIQTWVVDSIREEIVFTPPSPEEIPDMMRSLFAWLQDETIAEIHSVVVAGIARRWLIHISPFVSGNESAAFLLSLFILRGAGYDCRKWGRFSDYYADNITLYYQKLFSITEERFITEWLEYYTDGIRDSFNRFIQEAQSEIDNANETIIRTETEISPVQTRVESPIPAPVSLEIEDTDASQAAIKLIQTSLNERQRLILKMGEQYNTFHRRDIIAELEITGRYSPKTISRDLKWLVDNGYLEQGGARKGIFYSLKKNRIQSRPSS